MSKSILKPSKSKPKFFKFRNVDLAYYDSGGKGPVWLLTHGNGFSAACHQFYFNKLKKAKQRVVALDFAGHGLSESTLDFQNWDFYRDQIAALIDHLKLSDVIGFGHSMGAAALMRAAAIQPQKFKVIIALDPTLLRWWSVIYTAILEPPISKYAKKRREVFVSREKAGKLLRRTPTFASWSDESFDGYLQSCFRDQSDGSVKLSCSAELEAKNFRSQGAFSLLGYRRLKVPIHFILPINSEVCPTGRARQIMKNNTSSTLVIDERFAHTFPFTHPNETWEYITKLRGGLQ